MNRVDLLALCRVKDVSWHFIAREAQRPGGLERLLSGTASEDSTHGRASLELILDARDALRGYRDEVQSMLRSADSEGYRLTTVLDDDYPVNLRTIYNLPPFLFYRGHLDPDDALSVAVVGTRQPTPPGVARAHRIAAQLSRAGVTVLSGLARGIDTTAHEACLDQGGRTVAVLGSGIRRIYPKDNLGLAERIAKSGAVVSQFWPDAAPTTYSFPRRNVVMSGMGQGTVVIEASVTSGAKMQARFAIEHGKQVFLLKSLVTEREWARKYLQRPGVREIEDVGSILQALRTSEEIFARAQERSAQLALALG